MEIIDIIEGYTPIYGDCKDYLLPYMGDGHYGQPHGWLTQRKNALQCKNANNVIFLFKCNFFFFTVFTCDMLVANRMEWGKRSNAIRFHIKYQTPNYFIPTETLQIFAVRQGDLARNMFLRRAALFAEAACKCLT